MSWQNSYRVYAYVAVSCNIGWEGEGDRIAGNSIDRRVVNILMRYRFFYRFGVYRFVGLIVHKSRMYF